MIAPNTWHHSTTISNTMQCSYFRETQSRKNTSPDVATNGMTNTHTWSHHHTHHSHTYMYIQHATMLSCTRYAWLHPAKLTNADSSTQQHYNTHLPSGQCQSSRHHHCTHLPHLSHQTEQPYCHTVLMRSTAVVGEECQWPPVSSMLLRGKKHTHIKSTALWDKRCTCTSAHNYTSLSHKPATLCIHISM